MRILINGTVMLGKRTGLGCYVEQLLSRLRVRPEVEQIGVFSGQKILPLEDFLRAADAPSAAQRYDGLRRIIRQVLPGGRTMARAAMQALFHWRTRGQKWSLYHEPNFVPFSFTGPVVTTVHDLAFMRYPQFLPNDRYQQLKQGIRPILEQSRAIIAVSQFTRQELLELCPAAAIKKIVVAPQGVDLRRFRPPEDRARCRAEASRLLGTPPQYILYVGTLEPRKNLQGLLAAYQLLPKVIREHYPLVLAGTSGWKQEYFHDLLTTLRQRGQLLELGYVPHADLPLLLQAATVFCFPSLYEGFGLPPLEAAACGTPVVCANTASLPEVMGDAAVYVDPRVPEEIAEGLMEVLENDTLRDRLRQRGPERARHFTWEETAEQTVRAYREAA